MTKHHLRKREPGWRKGVVINGFGALLSAIVAIIIAVTKFADGAWAILIVLPLLVVVFLRLNRQYVREAAHLEVDVPGCGRPRPILRRHVVLVFVDQLDLAAARAIQYARTLTPDELRAVHFVIDDEAAQHLADEWGRLGLHRVSLELVECPDRRLTRTAVETVARELSDGQTEVSVLLPDRKYRGLWHRILHDRTAEAIQERGVAAAPRQRDVGALPVRHHRRRTGPAVGAHRDDRQAPGTSPAPAAAGRGEAVFAATPTDRTDGHAVSPVPGCEAIANVRYRDQVRVAGRVRSVRVAPMNEAPTLELEVDDGTAALSAVFLGRRHLAGIGVGSKLVLEGTVGLHKQRLAMLNPVYELRLPPNGSTS